MAFSSFEDFSRSGALWIVYGQPDRYSGDLEKDAAELTLSSFSAPAQSGDELVHMASGDLNGDGYGDLIMGAGRAGQTGEATAIFGPIAPGTHLQPDQFDTHIPLDPPALAADGGVFASSGFGRALFAHDLNSDGLDELFIGAKGYTPPRPAPQDVRNVGGAFIFDFAGARSEKGFDDLLAYQFHGNNDGTRSTLPNVEFGGALTAFHLGGADSQYVAILDEVRSSSIYLFQLPTTLTDYPSVR